MAGGWTNQRQEDALNNPSAYWAKELGIDSHEEQVAALYAKSDGFDDLGIKTIDAHIESASFDRMQILEACRIDLNFLAAMAMPTTFQYEFSPTHVTAWQILTGGEIDAEKKFLQIALGIPRGHAKTTLIKLFLLWCVLFSTRKFILVTASTLARAMDITSDVADMLDEPNIRAVFGDWNQNITTDTKELKKFGFRGRNITIAAIGAEGSVRGLNIKNERPDIMIFDDIQTKECADSAMQSKLLEEWMVGTAMKAKSPSRCLFIYAGNMFSTPHSILRKLKTNPTWIKFISGAILADGTALWPEHRSLDSLIEELNNDIAMGQANLFFSEVLNDTNVGTNTTVDYSKFPEWPWTKLDLPQGKFIIIDPAQGKGKDADAIGIVEVYDEQAGIRQVFEKHLSPSNLVRFALILAIENNIGCIAVEATGYQYTLLHWFEEICREVGIEGIQFVPIYMGMASKNARILAGIKSMQTREVFLHPDVKSIVMQQIADWNPMKRDNVDDVLDLIASVRKVIADYAYEIMTKTNLTNLQAEAAQVVENNSCF